MSNKLLLIVILISLLVGGVIGFVVKAGITPQTIHYSPEIKTELIVKKIPVRIYQTKYLEKERMITDTVYKIPEFIISDSLHGKKDSIEYKVVHSIDNRNDSIKSRWDVSVNSLLKEYIKEKLVIEVKEIPKPVPFFADGWFWTTFTSLALLVLTIIF
jgi:hypothetical protein